MKFFSFAGSYQSLATHINIFSITFVGSLETSSKVRILAVFREAYLGTRPKLMTGLPEGHKVIKSHKI